MTAGPDVDPTGSGAQTLIQRKNFTLLALKPSSVADPELFIPDRRILPIKSRAETLPSSTAKPFLMKYDLMNAIFEHFLSILSDLKQQIRNPELRIRVKIIYGSGSYLDILVATEKICRQIDRYCSKSLGII